MNINEVIVTSGFLLTGAVAGMPLGDCLPACAAVPCSGRPAANCLLPWHPRSSAGALDWRTAGVVVRGAAVIGMARRAVGSSGSGRAAATERADLRGLPGPRRGARDRGHLWSRPRPGGPRHRRHRHVRRRARTGPVVRTDRFGSRRRQTRRQPRRRPGRPELARPHRGNGPVGRHHRGSGPDPTNPPSPNPSELDPIPPNRGSLNPIPTQSNPTQLKPAQPTAVQPAPAQLKPIRSRPTRPAQAEPEPAQPTPTRPACPEPKAA